MNTEHIEITGAKIKGDLFCHYTFSQEIGEDIHDSGLIKSERPIHDDLRNAFAFLPFHMPVIFQYLTPEQILDPASEPGIPLVREEAKEIISLFKVTEFTLDTEINAVSLIGTMSLGLGISRLETPFVKLEGQYHFALELQTAIAKICDEVKQYIDGKQAPRFVQTDMFNDETTVITDDTEVPEKPKKPRGRPKKKKAKTVLGHYEDSNFPEYVGRDIVSEDTAEVGDIIGVDANDGAPILKEAPRGEETPFGSDEIRTEGGPLNTDELANVDRVLSENGMQMTEEGRKALAGYTPEPDSEFNRPASDFYRDPAEVAKENGF